MWSIIPCPRSSDHYIRLYSGCSCKAKSARSSNISWLFLIKQMSHSRLLRPSLTISIIWNPTRARKIIVKYGIRSATIKFPSTRKWELKECEDLSKDPVFKSGIIFHFHLTVLKKPNLELKKFVLGILQRLSAFTTLYIVGREDKRTNNRTMIPALKETM